jgi:transposase
MAVMDDDIMNYIGVDTHKKYSVLCARNEDGEIVLEGKVQGNERRGFEEFFAALEGPCKVTLEAAWNWGKVHDILEQIAGVEEVVLAHPYKTRIIAEAQVKTDKLDARALAFLLRINAVPRAHVPKPATRQRKEVLRQRLFWVRERTKIRNRVHALLDRQKQELELSVCSDLFGVKGMKALEALAATPPAPEGTLLRQDLEVMKELKAKIAELEKMIGVANAEDETATLLASMPGVGLVLGGLLSCEIDDVGLPRCSARQRLLRTSPTAASPPVDTAPAADRVARATSASETTFVLRKGFCCACLFDQVFRSSIHSPVVLLAPFRFQTRSIPCPNAFSGATRLALISCPAPSRYFAICDLLSPSPVAGLSKLAYSPPLKFRSLSSAFLKLPVILSRNQKAMATLKRSNLRSRADSESSPISLVRESINSTRYTLLLFAIIIPTRTTK